MVSRTSDGVGMGAAVSWALRVRDPGNVSSQGGCGTLCWVKSEGSNTVGAETIRTVGQRLGDQEPVEWWRQLELWA